MYGLAVDRVVSTTVSNTWLYLQDIQLEFEVVSPEGALMKANACSNTDLFFALRGGGGGTFGIVLQVTMKANPQISFPV